MWCDGALLAPRVPRTPFERSALRRTLARARYSTNVCGQLPEKAGTQPWVPRLLWTNRISVRCDLKDDIATFIARNSSCSDLHSLSYMCAAIMRNHACPGLVKLQRP